MRAPCARSHDPREGARALGRRPGAEDGDGPVPQSWRHAAEVAKEIIGWPEWPSPPVLQSGAIIRPVWGELRTASAETIDLLVPLGEKNGPGLEGVRLRVCVYAFRRQFEVTATLEASGGRSFCAIARVDAWPADPHMNTRCRKNTALGHLPSIVAGDHVHRFSDNAHMGRKGFAPYDNLPAAIGTDEPVVSFRQFLRIVSLEFRVDGIEDIPPPDSWQVLL